MVESRLVRYIESRRFARYDVDLPCELFGPSASGGEMLRYVATMRNLSLGGGGLRFPLHPNEEDLARVSRLHTQALGWFDVELRWQAGLLAGVRFTEDSAAERIDKYLRAQGVETDV